MQSADPQVPLDNNKVLKENEPLISKLLWVAYMCKQLLKV